MGLRPPTPFVAPRENALRNKTPPLREGLLLCAKVSFFEKGDPMLKI